MDTLAIRRFCAEERPDRKSLIWHLPGTVTNWLEAPESAVPFVQKGQPDRDKSGCANRLRLAVRLRSPTRCPRRLKSDPQSEVLG